MADKDHDEDVNTNEPTGDTNQELTAEDLLKQIKAGDGRQKYASVEDAVKSVAPAQEHISKLEEDNAAMKEEVTALKATSESRDSIEEAVSKMLQNRAPDTSEPGEAPALDEDRLNDIVRTAIEGQKRTEQEALNSSKVVEVLTRALGTPAAVQKKFDDVAKELSLPVKELHAMARTSPTSVFRLLGVNPDELPAPPVEITEGSINPRSLPKVTPDSDNVPSPFKIGSSTEDLLKAWNKHKPQP